MLYVLASFLVFLVVYRFSPEVTRARIMLVMKMTYVFSALITFFTDVGSGVELHRAAVSAMLYFALSMVGIHAAYMFVNRQK